MGKIPDLTRLSKVLMPPLHQKAISLDRNVSTCNSYVMDEKPVNEKSLHELVMTLASCTDADLIHDFLRSLLTPSEVAEIANRWALVRLLDEGMSQRNIAKELGLSLCNITRGSKELKKENSAFSAMLKEYKKQYYVQRDSNP